MLEEMPPFPDRESSLLSKLYQTAPWTSKLHKVRKGGGREGREGGREGRERGEGGREKGEGWRERGREGGRERGRGRV